MFSREQLQRAIEDALKSMEGIALELYRRGREEAREELEEARARNADMRAMLEQVTRERDEARASCPDCAMWAERSARWHDDMQRAERERDEAREQANTLLINCESYFQDSCRMRKERDEAWGEIEVLRASVEGEPWGAAVLKQERDEARAEVERWKRSCNVFRERDWPKAFQATVTSLEREVSDAHKQLAKLRKLSKPWEGDAYRRGAEAMREACARWMSEREGISQWVYDDALADLSIPEEP